MIDPFAWYTTHPAQMERDVARGPISDLDEAVKKLHALGGSTAAMLEGAAALPMEQQALAVRLILERIS